jgi:hypothetical protein
MTRAASPAQRSSARCAASDSAWTRAEVRRQHPEHVAGLSEDRRRLDRAKSRAPGNRLVRGEEAVAGHVGDRHPLAAPERAAADRGLVGPHEREEVQELLVEAPLRDDAQPERRVVELHVAAIRAVRLDGFVEDVEQRGAELGRDHGSGESSGRSAMARSAL